MATNDLNPRSGRVLTTVVREYIQTGEPVASVVVARRGSLGVSSATIRSVLARLEEQGFVRQPHTSAGRVPTDRGYRFYVDLLLESRRPSDRSTVADQIRQVASEESSFERLLAQVSHVLSQDSHHVGFALAPATDDQRLQKIEFVSVGGSRVLVLAVADSGHVTQKIVDTTDVLSPEELRRAAECINRDFSGLAIEEVRAEILARLQAARGLYDRLQEHALQMADRALDARSREQTFTSTAPRRLAGGGVAAARGAVDSGAARAGRDDRGKAAAGAAAQRVSGGSRTCRDHRRRAHAAGPEAVQPDCRILSRRQSVAAASASSGRRGCAIRAPLARSRAPPARSARRWAATDFAGSADIETIDRHEFRRERYRRAGRRCGPGQRADRGRTTN